MSSRFADPDYQLIWPRALFVAECAKLLNRRNLTDWDDRCEILLDHAFIGDHEGGPVSEFREVVEFPWDTLSRADPQPTLTAKQTFLLNLMRNAENLQEDASHRRPYWRERKAGQRGSVVLDPPTVVREFVDLVNNLDSNGYFEKRFGKDCVDDARDDSPSRMIERELGVGGAWPLNRQNLASDLDLFFDIVEFLHDMVSRPLVRWNHPFAGCGWHHANFEIEPGRTVYRWRVNTILERSNLGLLLAEEGDDVGRLVAVTNDARTQLVQAVADRDDGEPSDQVRHALALFRDRGADRNQKRSAVAALALVLEAQA